MKNKIFFVMVFVLTVIAFTVSVNAFVDMPDDWSTQALTSAAQNGLLSGNNDMIMPKDNLTRCQMAKVISVAFGATEKGDISSFSDVSKDKWYADYMAIAYKMGVFSGDGSGHLNPESNITREEVFKVIASAFNLYSNDFSSLSKFSDSGLVSDWAKPYVSAMVANGYVNGSNELINPKGYITRAEFAQVMYNTIKVYVDKNADISKLNNISGNVVIRENIGSITGLNVNGDVIFGDGVTDDFTLSIANIKGRIVIRNSLDLTISGNVGSIVSSAENVIVTELENTTVGSKSLSGNGSKYIPYDYIEDDKPSVVIPVSPILEPDLWTDFYD